MSEMVVVEKRGEVVVPAAVNDAAMIRLWLHGRNPTTGKAYSIDVAAFFAFVGGKPMALVRLAELQAYADTLAHLAPSSRARKLAAIKSLFSFAQRIGYVPFNVGAALRIPTVVQQLSARIMTEADTHRLIALEPNRRNRTLLTLLYSAGLRASEAAGLRWADLCERDAAGQVTVLGKGGKVRSILLPATVWTLVTGLRGDAKPEAPVFRSRGGKPLDRTAIYRVVRAAAMRAGIGSGVSPHWLRHASCSHALDRGCPAHLVQTTLGHASLATTSRYAHARPNDSSALYLAI